MQFNKEQKISPAQVGKCELDELSEDELQSIVGGQAGQWIGVADNKGMRQVWVPDYHVNTPLDLSKSTTIIPRV